MGKVKKQNLSGTQGMIPELRFPDFTNNDQWKADTVQNIVTTKSPPKKLQSSEYLDEGVFPIIDQSQSFYCGYTNDQQAIINEDLPLVIFGDHTCSLKMAREPFAQGADGIKILKSKAFIDPEYLYQYLTYNGVKQENYKRHYSKLKEKIVPYPEFESGEQQKIASCLSSLDELLAAHNDKLDALKDHKKGLLQNLFPQEGETVPKVRFPEFEGDGEWELKTFEELFSIGSGKDYKHLEEGEIPVYGSGGYMLSVNDYLYDGESVCIGRKGTIDNPIFLTGKFWTVDTLFYTHDFNECIPKFIFYVFLNINWLNHNEAGGVPSLSKKNLYKIETAVPPTKEEQQKIASCLSAVDELITAQKEKIEQLQQHKKGLMQGLFPKIES